MAQPKYDSNTGMPVYSVQTDLPAYLCKEFDCLDCGTNDMQVVFSGIDPADCNCEITSPGQSRKITSTTLNGTHTLESVGNCTWFLGVSSVVTFTDYDSEDCTGTSAEGTPLGVLITLSYGDSGWSLIVDTETPTYTVFDGDTISYECPDGLVIANSGGSDCPSSGTATVTQL